MPIMFLRVTNVRTNFRTLLSDLAEADCVLKSKHGETWASKSDYYLFELKVLLNSSFHISMSRVKTKTVILKSKSKNGISFTLNITVVFGVPLV